MLSGGCSAFEAAVPPIVPRATKRRLMSTERGEWMESGFDVAHWSRLVKEPVLFYPAVERMRAKGIDTFIDVGPGASMSYLIKRLGGQVLSFSQALAAAKQAVDCAVPKPMALRRSEISL